MTIRPILLALGLALIAQSALAQQTQEEIRFQAELKACETQPEPQRKACIDAVQAKIKAAWIARIEAESRRRQAP
ncbi:MAG: hypothetical protein JNM30_13980 [Rhodospirillales bacterium]|nr:hypothetical protein [Rhodospirillales bacterium]